MTAPNHPTPLPSVFSPLAKALLDAFSEAVIVFDPQGKVLYANQQARELGLDLSRPASDLTPALAELGGRLKPLRVANLDLGEAMFVQGSVGPTTLADREREAIVRSLDEHAWRLAETAWLNGPPVKRIFGDYQSIRKDYLAKDFMADVVPNGVVKSVYMQVNVGPGLGEVGPTANFAVLSDFQTWICTFAMMLGRLELLTVFVLLTPAFWRR